MSLSGEGGVFMHREAFLQEVERRLLRMFSASKQGYKAAPIERHRLEGFMQAGKFLGLAGNTELVELMESVHLRVFGKTIGEHRSETSINWQEDPIDYSRYEQPPFMRE